jgi:signal transduction histidine kinase
MAALHVGLAHFIHEITNPLHIISYTVSLIEQEMPKANGNGDSFAYRAIPRLKGEVDQMISLVKSLRSQLECLWLVNSRVDSIDLGSLIDEVLHSEAARFDSGGVRTHMNMPADLPAIRADENLLKQALLNLLGNAREAMPKGGALIISACARDHSVSLEIADTGVGIPPGLDVFHPFATTKPKGMGLGLAITRHIVQSYDGTITYRSQPGNGTTFCLTFPLSG